MLLQRRFDNPAVPWLWAIAVAVATFLLLIVFSVGYFGAACSR
jgi:hypothetical protein